MAFNGWKFPKQNNYFGSGIAPYNKRVICCQMCFKETVHLKLKKSGIIHETQTAAKIDIFFFAWTIPLIKCVVLFSGTHWAERVNSILSPTSPKLGLQCPPELK